MNYKDVLEIIKNEKTCVERAVAGCDRKCEKCDLLREDKEILQSYDIAIKSIERQIPKKPDIKITNKGINVTGEYDIDSHYLCPVCKCVIGDCETEDFWYKYCPDCGQVINWSNSDIEKIIKVKR